MAYLYLGLALLALGVWVYYLFDVVSTPEEACRTLPKPVWVLLVLLLPKLGALLWVLGGRPRKPAPTAPPLPSGPFPEYERPGRARAADPAEDEEFLRRCRERAEEQRRRARETQERDEDQQDQG